MQSSDGATGDIDRIAASLSTALRERRFDELLALLDPAVTWGDCAGASDVIELVSGTLGGSAVLSDLDVTSAADRIVLQGRLGHDGPLLTLAVFVTSGRISEIVDSPDRDHALSVRSIGDLEAAAQRGWRAARVSPVFAVTDVVAAAANYRKLGFTVRAYEGEAAYAFATRDDIELHLSQADGIDPQTNSGCLYLYVDDADALYGAWRLADVGGRLTAPLDTDYGPREGAYVDPDGNLIRFGAGTT